MIFEHNVEENLFNLHEGLLGGRFQHGDYTPFKIYDPKERQIHKTEVRDRVIHQAVVNVIEQIFDRQFIFDSFSCRKRKGIHSASKRLQEFLRTASKNNTKTVYALKCDIRKFFDTVDHQILLEQVARKITDADTAELLVNIISSFNKIPGKGLPIGNLTSQLFANVYLHELDYYVKQILREKWYLRYCDDFMIISQSRTHLAGILVKIKSFLQKRLKLDIHPHKVSFRSWGQGIDFVGYVHLPHCVVLRTRTRKRMLRRVKRENLPSYLGLCKHADTFELTQLLLNKIGRQP